MMFGGKRRRELEEERRSQEQAEAAQRAKERREAAQHALAKDNRERQKRLRRRVPLLSPGGLDRRWLTPLQRGERALETIGESRSGVGAAARPGRAFAEAAQHLDETESSVERALGRCQDIALAAQQLQATLKDIPKGRADDRGRIRARLDEADRRLDKHVDAMESAAIAARELVLQASLTTRDEDAVTDIDARLRAVSSLLDQGVDYE